MNLKIKSLLVSKKTNFFILVAMTSIFLTSNGFCQTLRPLSDERYRQILDAEDKISVSTATREETVIEKELIYLENFPRISPIDFLRFLATRPYGFVSIGFAAPQGWVTKRDIRELIKYIKSTQPASPVVSEFSSFAPSKVHSTVGMEAMCIIALYRGQTYPSECNNFYYTRPDKQSEMAEEFLIWWRQLE